MEDNLSILDSEEKQKVTKAKKNIESILIVLSITVLVSGILGLNYDYDEHEVILGLLLFAGFSLGYIFVCRRARNNDGKKLWRLFNLLGLIFISVEIFTLVFLFIGLGMSMSGGSSSFSFSIMAIIGFIYLISFNLHTITFIIYWLRTLRNP